MVIAIVGMHHVNETNNINNTNDYSIIIIIITIIINSNNKTSLSQKITTISFFCIIPDLTGFLQGDEDHFHLRVFQRHQKKTGSNIPERLSTEWSNFNRVSLFLS